MWIPSGSGLAPDAETNFRILQSAGMAATELTSQSELRQLIASLSQQDLIVDGLLGTGFRGILRAPLMSVVAWINESPAAVLALDIPSGLDCDLGPTAQLCVRAQHTVTFVGRKQCFDLPESRNLTGEITVAHIGLPEKWVRQWLRDFRATSESSNHG
ncbi:MAG: NAD(P)H-hydrate epimerase [Planctomycetaceae bacterium]